jgi:hypothetical protein
MNWVLIAIVGWNRTCLEIERKNCTSLNDIEGGEYFDGFSIPRQIRRWLALVSLRGSRFKGR